MADNMSSISSCGSTASSKARASAKRAALKVRLQRLAEMEQLEQAELKLKQQKCRFEQETALAEAEAEEQVYESLEADPLDGATSEIKQAASPPLLSDPWWSGQPLQSSNIFDTPPEEINRTLPPPVVPITSSSLAVTHPNPQPSPAIQLADPTSQPFPVSQPSSFNPETSAVNQPVYLNQQLSPVIQLADPTPQSSPVSQTVDSNPAPSPVSQPVHPNPQASPVNRPAHLNPQSSPVSQTVDSNLAHSPVSQPVHPDPQTSPVSTTKPLQPKPVNVMSEMGNIMFRKELLALSLRGFNDSTATYRTWKASIVSSVKELNIPPSQELNLVMKWLGNDSRKLVEPLHSVYIDQPAEALKQIWGLLDDTYGSPEAIESNVMIRLQEFPRLSAKESGKLLQLDHLLLEVLHLKKSGKYPGLASLDSAHGINPIVQKLPPGLQDKWMKHGSKYKSSNARLFPPFEVFHGFIHSEAKMRNDPSFLVGLPCAASECIGPIHTVKSTKPVSVRKTEVTNSREEDLQMCVLHNSQHPLHECRLFRKKPLLERRQLLKELGVCYKCCRTTKHVARNCENPIKCEDCGSDRHVTALHIRIPPQPYQEQSSSKGAGIQAGSSTEITNACTDVCGFFPGGKSCAKICKVKVYREDRQEQTVPAYAVIDDQSNSTLAKGELFDLLGISSPPTTYAMKTCAGSSEVTGRDTAKLWIKSTDGQTHIRLPFVRECDMIPDKLDEIPSPEVARHHPHLQRIANEIEPIDPAIPILLLIGRDVLQAHKVREQINGPDNAPYAQRLDLGWVIVGDVCLNGLHRKDGVSVYKTELLLNTGRPSTVFEPCQSSIQVCDCYRRNLSQPAVPDLFDLGEDSISPSREEAQFLSLMKSKGRLNEDGQWQAPLPFRPTRPKLPNNRDMAWRRAKSLHASLCKDPKKKEHLVTFMKGIIDKGHAEKASPIADDVERWYLPLFGVYNPHKPDKIRGVFDSSASFEGLSLNQVLLKGPDLTNNLLGVLLRFRTGRVAMCADIESMFYCFRVPPEHRDYLRFFWYEDNVFGRKMIEYRMCVHVFGNKPSPPVANYGLRAIVEDADPDVKEFVQRNFYVDDGLKSCDEPQSAVSLLKRTQKALMEGGKVRLHKIASNSQQVLSEFHKDDIAKDIAGFDIEGGDAPLQRSLGLEWRLHDDVFTFSRHYQEKPFTKRGVLAVINSVFDPLGFLSPVLLKGRVLLRNMLAVGADWDDPLPASFHDEWEAWKADLGKLSTLQVPRSYSNVMRRHILKEDVHVFCDASEQAVAAVVYLRTFTHQGSQVGFVLGKSRIAPKQGFTIPRLELCSAVLAIELAKTVSRDLDFPPASFTYHSDSKVVLGYINNTTRRFHTFVANRVDKIVQFSTSNQWRYVASENNPADQGTRCLEASKLPTCSWLTGPKQWRNRDVESESPLSFPLIEPEQDKELRREEIGVMKTEVNRASLSTRAEKFSSWSSFIRALMLLTHIVRCFKGVDASCLCKGWHHCCLRDIQLRLQVEKTVLQRLQEKHYHREMSCLKEHRPLPKDSVLLDLNPVMNEDGLICVGGRLRNCNIPVKLKHPVILPGRCHIASLLVRHFHNDIHHQGRHLTEGAIREGEFWITGCKRLVSSVIHHCVPCRKLRGAQSTQRMADLPEDRLSCEPAFTNVGIDCFGPWEVVARRTRGGIAKSKRWAVMFSCLSSRAVHIEIIEEMSTSSFINALRRFTALRGPIRTLRSDQGTNFVGAIQELQSYLTANNIDWKLNPPHASHMGGAWERLIGVTRRVLDGMCLNNTNKNMTHEVLVTLMAEVSGIINSRPLLPLSTDPEDVVYLTPTMLLTQKHPCIEEIVIINNKQNMYKAQWKLVQIMADQFWTKWKAEYLPTLQTRRKWKEKQRNVKVGDVVLLRDKGSKRAQWPMGVIDDLCTGEDGCVREVSVRLPSTGRSYVRPIHELVMLVESLGCQ